MNATTLELFFIDGQPDGMLTAEVFGWTGHILATPRTRLSEALKRKESSYTGVYILLGEQDEEPLAYIGESESIATRIKSHDAQKNWWTKAIFITSADNKLHKAYVQYLESRLVQEGITAGNTKLENGTNPSLPSLSEAAQKNMEVFMSQLLMVLPAIKVDLFTSKVKSDKKNEEKKKSIVPSFELTLKKEGIVATAKLEDGEFIVQKGSMARSTYIGERNERSSYWNLWSKLVEQGILEDIGNHKVFTQSYAFSSTSAAASVCTGRPTSGPFAWKEKKSKKTYQKWEEARLAED